MAQVELKVAAREEAGKGVARSLRREGLVPGVVYGKDLPTCSLVVEPKALEEALETEAGWNALITLQGDGAFAGRVVILKDMQTDPIKGNVLHVDFQAIDLKQKTYMMVPVHPMGKSAGEKAGGSLQVIRHELEAYCLPTQIPTAFEVDVSALEIGDVVHVEDLVLPEGVEIPHDVNFTVITVTGLKPEEEELEGEEEVEEEEAEAPEESE